MILYVPERTKVSFQFKTRVSLMHTNWHPSDVSFDRGKMGKNLV